MLANTYNIILPSDKQEYLKLLIMVRTVQVQVVDRARMLLWKSEVRTDKSIADKLGVSVNTVRRRI